MVSTRVVNLRNSSYDVYIGRGSQNAPSVWGNQFSHLDGTLAQFRVFSREEAVERHEASVWSDLQLIKRIREELQDKTLGCFCYPLMCHGDLLCRIANGWQLPPLEDYGNLSNQRS